MKLHLVTKLDQAITADFSIASSVVPTNLFIVLYNRTPKPNDPDPCKENNLFGNSFMYYQHFMVKRVTAIHYGTFNHEAGKGIAKIAEYINNEGQIAEHPIYFESDNEPPEEICVKAYSEQLHFLIDSADQMDNDSLKEKVREVRLKDDEDQIKKRYKSDLFIITENPEEVLSYDEISALGKE